MSSTKKESKVNRMRRLLLVALGIKVSVVVLALSIIGVSYLMAKVWFEPNASEESIARALEIDRDVDARNEAGLTGLMYAAGIGDFNRIRALIAHGAQVNLQSSKEGDTALNIACYNGDFPDEIKIIEWLIASKADVNIPNKDGQYPIHYALQITNIDKRLCIMRLLVAAGANINAQNNDGNTIVHLALEQRQKAWIEMAYKVFGKNLDLFIKNKKGRTPLEHAQHMGLTGTDSAEELLERLMKK